MANKHAPSEAPKGKRLVHSKYITRKGRRIYAATYGLQCFTFYVDA